MRLPQIARRPVSVTVLAATLLSGWGCHRGGAALPRPAKAEATQPTEGTGAWYRGLVQIHGERLIIGTAPASADDGYWISSKSESEPTAEEYNRFYDGLSTRLRALAELRLPGVDSLKVAYLGGDFYGTRTEELLFDPEVYLAHLGAFIEVIDLVQSYLQAPEHRQYRLGYFAPSSSLVIYPDALFVGPRRFARAEEARAALAVWLDGMHAEAVTWPAGAK
jgi:hypothetical protein